ncbi:MAG: hypothetical protein JSW38_01915 [Dehalococcoidia bacterium]|nr:MAG: hypothetical protein JSV02_08965 [Dehalococcoidia bacterium]UCG83598.1 MAG: hypothetical protein JSW38_01915 [Dehalococcoidia bacterium]
MKTLCLSGLFIKRRDIRCEVVSAMGSPSLKRARIRYSDRAQGKLQCQVCGAEWIDWGYRLTQIRQRRRKGWWKCPGGCNTDVIEDFPPPGEIEGGS